MLVSWGPVILLSGVAFIPTLFHFLRRRHPGWLIHLAILHYLITSVMFYAQPRYRVPVEPFFVILAIQALTAVASRVRSTVQPAGADRTTNAATVQAAPVA
jgi:hypothetical protein